MTFSSDDPGYVTHISASRRAAAQALAAMMLLVPVTIAASYTLATAAGAARPGISLSITAALAVVGCLAILRNLSQPEHYPHSRLGACNLVTLTRGAGITLMAGLIPVAPAEFGWALAGFAGLLLAMDGLDGLLARRSGLQSAFGARFDVESDVVFSLTMAGLAVAMGHIGLWFLIIGLLRPLFIAAGHIWPLLGMPLPEAPRRKYIAGVQMGVQVGLLTPLAAHNLGAIMGALVLMVTLMSFSIDIRWLIQHRRTSCRN